MAENTKTTKSTKPKKNTIPKNKEWLDLCSWVELNIFNYDKNQKLQKAACLVLKGLTTGQCIANNNCQTYGEYSYDVILMTFKANKDKILRAIANKDFESERNKMSYVCAIVRNDINNIYTRMKNAEKSKKEALNTEITESQIENNNIFNKYNNREDTVKNEIKNNKILEELW